MVVSPVPIFGSKEVEYKNLKGWSPSKILELKRKAYLTIHGRKPK